MTKRELARHQLERAFLLFARDRDYACAITLAGAAEEILGRLVRSSEEGGSAAVDEEIALISQILRGQGHVPVEKEIREVITFARNSLKHLQVGVRQDTAFDFREEAEAIIERAVSNWNTLTGWWPESAAYDEYQRAKKA